MNFQTEHINVGLSDLYLMTYGDFVPSDFFEQLTPDELERMYKFSSLKRQREFVATRVLRHQLFGFEHIHYDQHGAPFIPNQGYLSISHGNQLVGIAINKVHRIGFDIEPIRKKIVELRDKFLAPTEHMIFDCKDPRVLTKIWSAKESMYKLAGRKKIHFKTELLLSEDVDANWLGLIDNHEHVLRVKLAIFDREDYVISINSEEPERLPHEDIRRF